MVRNEIVWHETTCNYNGYILLLNPSLGPIPLWTKLAYCMRYKVLLVYHGNSAKTTRNTPPKDTSSWWRFFVMSCCCCFVQVLAKFHARCARCVWRVCACMYPVRACFKCVDTQVACLRRACTRVLVLVHVKWYYLVLLYVNMVLTHESGYNYCYSTKKSDFIIIVHVKRILYQPT
jgi:hypothetical protein